MKQTSIEQRFGAAMRYAETLHERGFQARLGEATKVGTSNISEIIKKDKGALEKTRRSLFDAALSMTPALDGLTYESFLELGERILSGEDGGAVLEEIQSRPVRVRQMLHLIWDKAKDGPPGPDFVPVQKAKIELSAGEGTFVYDDGVEDVYYFRLTWLTRLRGRPNTDGLVVFPVNGASMEPSFKNGGVVLVDLLDTDLWDDKVYAIRIDDRVRLKRLKRSESMVNGVDVISDNNAINEKTGKPVYEDKTIDGAELCILGRVLWHAWEM